MPRATESAPDGLQRPLLRSPSSSISEEHEATTRGEFTLADQSVEVLSRYGSIQSQSSRGSSVGSPRGSMRSSGSGGSSSSIGPISTRSGGVTKKHEQALLPYSLMRERRALAAELRTVFATCAAAFAELPRVPGRGDAVSATDCRNAIAELCSPRSCRPGAFPFLNSKGKQVAVTLCLWGCVTCVNALLAVAVNAWPLFWIFEVYGTLLVILVCGLFLGSFVTDRSNSWLARACKWFFSMEDQKPESLPLYCDDPSMVAFGDRAMFLPHHEAARNETPIDTTTSVVTLHLFLSRCMVLCVPRTRDQQRKLLVGFGGEVDALGYPTIDAPFGYIRKAWCSLARAENKSQWNEGTVIDVSAFATAATRCSFCYTSTDVESIAAYIDTPDQMDFVEFVVLQLCLFMSASLGPEDDHDGLMDSLDTIQMELLDNEELDMRALVSCCTTEFEQELASLEGNDFSVAELCAIVFDRGLLPWLVPSQKDRDGGFMKVAIDEATSTWEATAREWKEAQEKVLTEYCIESFSSGASQPLGLGHVVDAAAQLYFDGQENMDAIAKVHAARACYEVVAGSLDVMANPNELLNLMYGHGTLLEDEKRNAMMILGAESFAELLLDLEQPASPNGIGDGMANAALDKVQRIKLNESATQETALLVDFGSWLQFALANNIPSSPTAEAFIFDVNMRKLQQQRLHKHSNIVAHGPGYATELFAVLFGWKGYRDEWKSADKRDHIGKRLASSFVLGTLLFMFTTMGPWYWTVFSWRITGTVPPYFAWSPLLLVLPACHFWAKAQSEASPDKAASRLRLISIATADGRSMTADGVWKLICRIGDETKLANTMGVFVVMVEVTSLLCFGVVLPQPPTPGSIPWGLAQVVPSYLQDNPNCTLAIGLWCLVYQCLFLVFGLAFGQEWTLKIEAQLGTLNRVVTCCPPIVDFNYPENIVAWCRLRDHTARHTGQSVDGKSNAETIAKVSVAWAVLSALASIVLTIKGAARTPYRLGCAWFGLIGGATAIIQLLCLVRCDRAVEAQAAMLESQLARIQQTLVMSDDKSTEHSTPDSALRTAVLLLQDDLGSYRNTPERRYYHLFGFPAAFVLKSVGGFVATQAGVYAWRYLNTLSIPQDGSGSTALEEECKVFMELPGC